MGDVTRVTNPWYHKIGFQGKLCTLQSSVIKKTIRKQANKEVKNYCKFVKLEISVAKVAALVRDWFPNVWVPAIKMLKFEDQNRALQWRALTLQNTRINSYISHKVKIKTIYIKNAHFKWIASIIKPMKRVKLHWMLNLISIISVWVSLIRFIWRQVRCEVARNLWSTRWLIWNIYKRICIWRVIIHLLKQDPWTTIKRHASPQKTFKLRTISKFHKLISSSVHTQILNWRFVTWYRNIRCPISLSLKWKLQDDLWSRVERN